MRRWKTIEEKMKNIKFWDWVVWNQSIFIIEKLTRDIIERCKLPEAIELRKKNRIESQWEEISIAEKIIELFPNKNIVLNKKFNNRKPDIWFKNNNLIIEVDEGNHENYDSIMKKKENTCLKSTILNFFDVITMILILIFLNF